jgi:hypothetical protein
MGCESVNDMPGLESNLTVVLLVLVAIAVLGALGWALWKPVLSRGWRYFKTWWERDKLIEAEEKRQRDARKLAEKELQDTFHQPEAPTTTMPAEETNRPEWPTPQKQRLGGNEKQ